MASKLSMAKAYRAFIRDVDWHPTYVDEDEAFPYHKFEGIKIHDWDAWEDPFRTTVETYHKFQAEKDRRLYAILDGQAQSQGHLNVSEGRYFNAMKVFLTGVTPAEYVGYRQFSFLTRYIPGPGPRFTCLTQSLDELRHTQVEIHALAEYNKYYSGLHSMRRMHDRVPLLSAGKSFLDDAVTAGPFENLTAISFAFEYLLTNLLFVPFMSAASFNGDIPTMTFGYSAQSDESRHMTMGLGVVKFMLEQDEGNIPIIQNWLNKWFWRSYRLTGLVAPMMDYMLPRKFMSFKEAFELYFEHQMLDGLFPDLAYYGIEPPLHVNDAIAEKDHVSHLLWWQVYSYPEFNPFQTWVPPEPEMEWLSEKYPDTFDRYYRPLWEWAQERYEAGQRLTLPGAPEVCQICQIPMSYAYPDRPDHRSRYLSEYEGEIYHLCSPGCKWIFDREPEKYIQILMPAHQILLGNWGGARNPMEVMEYAGIEHGVDNGEYFDSPDHASWQDWHEELARSH
jgi:phenol hydroxylase P3 protein